MSEILKLLNILRILIEIELYTSHAGPNAQTPIWAEISLSLLILSIWTHQIGHPHKANPNVWILVHCYPLDQRGWQNYRTVMTQSGNFAHTNKLHTVYTKLNWIESSLLIAFISAWRRLRTFSGPWEGRSGKAELNRPSCCTLSTAWTYWVWPTMWPVDVPVDLTEMLLWRQAVPTKPKVLPCLKSPSLGVLKVLP